MTVECKCPECLSKIDYDIRRKKIKDEFIEEDLISCPVCGCLLEITTDIKMTITRR
jgi:hypothetical protein